MNIAVVGTGNVGGTLGSRWAKAGHKVVFGARKPQDPKIAALLQSAGANARAATVSEAARDAEIVVFSTPWDGTQDAVKSAGNLSGKTVIDTTNPVIMNPEGLKRGLVIGHSTSAAEQVASWATGANVVKAFNTTGAGNMANPTFGSQKATMFICGDNADAKTKVKKLSDDLGFETVDAGPLIIARQLEPLAMLWIHMAIAMGMGPNFAFNLIKR